MPYTEKLYKISRNIPESFSEKEHPIRFGNKGA